MSDGRPRIDLRQISRTGGRPSEIAVSADGLRLLVFHDELGRVSGLESTSLRVVGGDVMGPAEGGRRFLRGRRGDRFFCVGATSRLAEFDASDLRFRGFLAGTGEPGDLVFLPDGSRGYLSVSDGGRGAMERREGDALEPGSRLDLGGLPVDGTTALCPRLGLGAVLVRSPQGSEDLVVWSLDPLEIQWRIPVGGGAAALAFSERESLLFAARPEFGEVVGVDLSRGEVSRRIMMLGRAYQLAGQPSEPGVWALSGSLSHLVRVDLPLGAGPAPVRLPGIDPARSRLRFSPEGRLAAVPEWESGQVVLLDMYRDQPSYGDVLDRLELGRPIADVAWSPFGDEIYAAGADGSVLALAVDRAGRSVRDTSEFLLDVQLPPGGAGNIPYSLLDPPPPFLGAARFLGNGGGELNDDASEIDDPVE